LKLSIIGPGLIGTSVHLAARRAWPDAHVVEIDRGQSLSQVGGADVIVLAAPVDAIIGIIARHGMQFGDALVLDVGSTKRAIVAAAREAGMQYFVGGHPMAGAASSGPAAARADLFDGRPWFLVAGRASPATVERARSFVESLGAKPVVLDDDGEEHDRVMAAVSHLPQVVASALIAMVGASSGSRLEWAGWGLRDTTRLADSSADVWAGILASNADQIRPLLLTLADDLRTFAGRLDDPKVVRTLFASANEHRRRLAAAQMEP
jgi:prephenate dehydrogenase